MNITITYDDNTTCKIESFSEIVNSEKIIILNCSGNQLTTLPELNLPNLQQLNCSDNQLTSLPDFNLPNLQQLFCSSK